MGMDLHKPLEGLNRTQRPGENLLSLPDCELVSLVVSPDLGLGFTPSGPLALRPLKSDWNLYYQLADFRLWDL